MHTDGSVEYGFNVVTQHYVKLRGCVSSPRNRSYLLGSRNFVLLRMRRFSNDWTDKVAMLAMWRAVFKNKARCIRQIHYCDTLLRTTDRIHLFTSRIFTTIANLEQQILAHARRGKRTVKLRGSLP